MISGAVFTQSLSNSFFTLFLSLNQAGHWGMQELLGRWISLFFLIPGYLLAGLRGACAGILLTEMLVLSIGLWYGRPYFFLSKMGLHITYLIPYLRFGLIFFATSLLLTAAFRSGELLIRFFHGDYAQVGFFGVALSIYFTILSVFHKFGSAFTPLLTTYLMNQEIEALKQWIENLLKWLVIGGILIIYGILMLGNDLIPLVLGSAYRPVWVLLLVLSISLLPVCLNHMANLLTLIYERPKMAFVAATLRLTAFWGFGIPLIAWFEGLGGCIALLTASILYAFYLTSRTQDMISYSLKRWFLTIALGCPFLPLIWLRSTLPMNIILYFLFLAGYGCVLFFLRIITLNEIIAFWQVIRARNLAPNPPLQFT